MVKNANLNENPLSDLISDETFERLSNYHLFNQRSVRNYLIKKQFSQLLSSNMSSISAIGELRKKFPELQHNTILKIIKKKHDK